MLNGDLLLITWLYHFFSIALGIIIVFVNSSMDFKINLWGHKMVEVKEKSIYPGSICLSNNLCGCKSCTATASV